MKQFRFKLQAVLDYRSEQVDRVRQILATEEKKRVDILQQIQAHEKAMETAFLERQQLLNESVLDPVQAQFFASYVFHLKDQCSKSQKTLEVQEKKLLEVRELLKQAMVKKKSLELLKEKDQTKFLKKIEKAEEAQLAELALNRMYYQSKG